ncbi:tetratricopeptide repeat protein, partial [bacterium]|nr:tetratricopeptide repeat protein [bacterium]
MSAKRIETSFERSEKPYRNQVSETIRLVSYLFAWFRYAMLRFATQPALTYFTTCLFLNLFYNKKEGTAMNFLPKHLLFLLATIIIISIGCGEHTPEWIPQPNASELISEPRLLHTVKIAQKAVVKDPKSAIAWGKLGHVYYIHGWRVEAAQCYRHAVELEPDEFSWFYYLGRSLDKTQPDEAADALAKAIALNAEYPPAHMAYARVLMALRKFDKAQQHFECAAELDPQEPLAELGLGELALKAKEFETARDHLQKALTLEPQQKEAHSALSQVYMALGDKDAASRHARLAQKFGDKPLNDPLLGKLQGYGATASWIAIRGGLLLRSGDFKRAA